MSTARAFYNEHDPKAAAWLRELVNRNLVAPGVVDERSIEAIEPHELEGFTQCHFFAGIGVWSYALRLAGWPDTRPVWTGSCPCPPFSAAGKNQACPQCSGTNPVPHVGRTGYFVCCLCQHEWFADARHLWPELWRLIRDGRPDVFFGEQVASADGRVWLTSVRASLEILAYAVGAADICAAGLGAPHIRQRLWFVADTTNDGWAQHEHQPRRRPAPQPEHPAEREGAAQASTVAHAASRREGPGLRDSGSGEQRRLLAPDDRELGDAESRGLGEHRRTPRDSGHAALADANDRALIVGDAFVARLEGHARHVDDRYEPGRLGENQAGSTPATGSTLNMGHATRDDERRLPDDTHRERQQAGGPSGDGQPLAHSERDGRRPDEQGRRSEERETDGRSGTRSRSVDDTDGREPGDGELQRSGRHPQFPADATTGFWRDVEWLWCKDGKYRPTKPGLFPLAHGIAGRVGLLRGAGNAVCAPVAQAFIEAYMNLERHG